MKVIKGKCICCGFTLTDAVSIERGIGPVCSREHYEGYDPTESQFELALGRVVGAQQMLPHDLLENLFRTVDGRAFANHLTRWASLNLNNTEAILVIAGVLGDLGFKVLADKVLARNTPVVITRQRDGLFGIECFTRPLMKALLPKTGAFLDDTYKGRFGQRWLFPDSARGDVWAVAGVVFGGEWATVPGPQVGDVSEIKRIPVRGAAEVKRSLEAPKGVQARPATAAPPVDANLWITDNGDGTLSVKTPRYIEGFVNAIRAVKGRSWYPDTKVWRVPASERQRVEQAILTHF